MPSSGILLEAEHIGRRHPDGHTWLLDDVSLTIEPRFVPKSGKLSQAPGVHVGQAGEFGVE